MLKPSFLTLEVTFPSGLSRDGLAVVVCRLLQSIASQRMQMPLQWDVLQKDLEIAIKEHSSDEEQPDQSVDTSNPRHAANQHRVRFQRAKKRERYIRMASKFVQDFTTLLKHLRNDLLQDASNIERISFFLGATPVTPKEVYHVHLPETILSADCAESTAAKRATLQLFRSMVTHDSLFQRMGTKMRPTNLYVAMKRRTLETSSSWLIPRTEFSSVQRGRVTEFRLHTPFKDSRIRNHLRTPRDPGSSCRKVNYAHVPMVMATPCPVRASCGVQDEDVATPARTISVAMIETPCANQKPTPGKAETNFTQCTPLLERRTLFEGNEEDESLFQWYISQEPIKGFVDPRI